MIPFEVRLRTARGREWRKFRDPVAVLRATRADDVVRCLGEVDRAVRRDGCYAAGFVTYEAAAAFGLPAADPATGGLPLVCFGLFSPDRVDSERSLPADGVYFTGEWQPSIGYPAGRPLRAALAANPIDTQNVFLYHKTTRREVYDRARASAPDADAVLLWNADGEVTESTDANIVVELDGQKVTPPTECGLLAGTLRADLLESGAIREQRVRIDDLARASGLWLINSVRGWMPAIVVK